MSTKDNLEKVTFKDMIIEILAEGEISEYMYEMEPQCICKDISKPNHLCPVHKDRRDEPQEGRTSLRITAKRNLSERYCPKHGLCTCKSKIKPDQKCPEHGTCICTETPTKDCPEHGKCTCKYSVQDDMCCPQHGACFCADVKKPHPRCPKHGHCVCPDKGCPKHGVCICMTRQFCPRHKGCGCLDETSPDRSCSVHGRCICPYSRCPLHGLCWCKVKKFLPDCPKHGPCICGDKTNPNCPEHGQCSCVEEGKWYRLCPRHGTCTCSFVNRPSCKCSSKDHPAPHCPEHGTRRDKPKTRKDDDQQCSCPLRKIHEPNCPMYERIKEKIPQHKVSCTCPSKSLKDPYCPKHGEYPPDGKRRLACTCDAYCPIHGKRKNVKENEKESPINLGPNCTCPSKNVNDPFCPDHGKYGRKNRKRPGAYGLLCTCPNKTLVDPYCRDHGKFRVNKAKKHLIGPLCSCSLTGEFDPYCPEHGSKVLLVADPNCAVHGRGANRTGKEECTCHSTQVKYGICEKLRSLSPCCECICDKIACLSPCFRKTRHDSESNTKNKDNDCCLLRKKYGEEIQRQKGDKLSPCQGTIEFDTKLFHKKCDFTIENEK